MLRILIFAVLLLILFLLLRRALEIWKSGRAAMEAESEAVALEPGNFTVADRLEQVGDAARARLLPFFRREGVAYPPARVALLGFKQEKILDLLAAGEDGEFRLIKSYPILAASGRPGPKLREGDLQVPEGRYEIELLNPNSKYHLSLRLNYPNPTDLLRAGEDDRDADGLGGDIMIHGRAVSAGCLAVGDPAIEELFTLVAESGVENAVVLLSPRDLRAGQPVDLPPELPLWVPQLYDEIYRELRQFPGPASARQ